MQGDRRSQRQRKMSRITVLKSSNTSTWKCVKVLCWLSFLNDELAGNRWELLEGNDNDRDPKSTTMPDDRRGHES